MQRPQNCDGRQDHERTKEFIKHCPQRRIVTFCKRLRHVAEKVRIQATLHHRREVPENIERTGPLRGSEGIVEHHQYLGDGADYRDR
jgi:hypothetical protein